MKKSYIALTTTALFTVSMANSALGDGSSPKGKPFIAINDHIVEVEGAVGTLQDQLNRLVARVDSVEQRVGANEEAIGVLTYQNAALETLVRQNLGDLVIINEEIASLKLANEELKAQLDTGYPDGSTLERRIAENEALITTLQSAVTFAQSDVNELKSILEAQIEKNTSLIVALEKEINTINDKLALKQNLVNGKCPDGNAIQQVLSDGSVICEGVGGVSGQLQIVQSFNYEFANAGSDVGVSAYCPSGYLATGAGYDAALGWDLHGSYTNHNGEYGFVEARNFKGYRDFIYSVTTCTRIAP